MIRKRLVSLFLAVVMLCSLSMTAFAASDEDVAMSAEQGIIASETLISADFNIDVDATGEISGGVVSRTVTGIVP